MKSITFDTKLDLFDSGEAFASVGNNPTFRWCKFILTDDKPNLNKNRIPVEEFDNLVRTGLFAPIKMASGRIQDGHDESIPLGTITSLIKEDNYIKGIAALWTLEREDDVEMIKQIYDEGKSLNLSWEVLYRDEEAEADGVTALRGTILRATTLVGMPAYAGRTPILQVASLDKENVEDTTLNSDELQKLLEEAQSQLEQLKQELDAMKQEKETAVTERDSAISERDSLVAERDELAKFKTLIETEKANAEKLNSIKAKFTESGVEKSDEYFQTNGELLLSLDEKALEFMLQELVAFASTTKEQKASTSDVQVPNLQSKEKTTLSPRELARELRSK